MNNSEIYEEMMYRSLVSGLASCAMGLIREYERTKKDNPVEIFYSYGKWRMTYNSISREIRSYIVEGKVFPYVFAEGEIYRCCLWISRK